MGLKIYQIYLKLESSMISIDEITADRDRKNRSKQYLTDENFPN